MAQWDGIGNVDDWGRHIAGKAPRPNTHLDPRDEYAALRSAVATLHNAITAEIRHRQYDRGRVIGYALDVRETGVNNRLIQSGAQLAALVGVFPDRAGN